MFDTHCHLNFKSFKKNLDEVILSAKQAGVIHIVVPGTDVKTSRIAIEICQKNDNIYAAVGIHPHHVFKYQISNFKFQNETQLQIEEDLLNIEDLLQQSKVVAVGEVGMDKHIYENTKYEEYAVNERFISLQKELLERQIDLALKYKRSLIIHNREAKDDLLQILREKWDSKLEYRAVFHCCEPDEELLAFAKEHKMFIGIDGDVTYFPEKQEFVKKIPLEMLVVETDSPYLLPEPLRSEKKYPNKPENIPLIAEYIAKILKINKEELIKETTENGKKLFSL